MNLKIRRYYFSVRPRDVLRNYVFKRLNPSIAMISWQHLCLSDFRWQLYMHLNKNSETIA